MARAERRAFERELKRNVKKARKGGAMTKGISTIQCPRCKYFIPVGGDACLCDDRRWEWATDGRQARFVMKGGAPSGWFVDRRR